MNAEVGRSDFQHELAALEQRAVCGLDLVLGQLDRALDALQRHDGELAKVVIVDDDDVDSHCANVYQGILVLVDVHASALGDLRLVGALLHVIKDVERIGDQCVKVARGVSAYDRPETAVGSEMLAKLVQMGESVRVGVVQGRRAFAERNVALAEDVIDRHRDDVNRLNRELVLVAAEAGGDADFREWATRMALVGRALKRIGDYTLAIGEQAGYVARSGMASGEASPIVGRDDG